MELRVSAGSPSIREQLKLFSLAVKRKKKYGEQISGREERIAPSLAHLKTIIEKYMMGN
jgi:hypothetical protein